ncbi:Ig-like protein group 4 [Rathayibacter tanaceti]|uniref:Bacterial Ig-like domain-containing protein n=2 Tax=Rathayibacter tanaceti TaxID=1671680 RepID=A0AAE6V870_9MICO|nr:LamG-like jellyroll fold domain-containing protein [Rathayibacter tanaceti]QHC56571.1 hypothetical protein GSU10_13645 [Rathayibacter tanaceti]TCO36788.1 Ig-like protein group 4 [Rathayibacter tanaceti]
MHAPHPFSRRITASIAALVALPVLAASTLVGGGPAAAADPPPAPAVLYTFDRNPSGSTIANEGSLGSAFDARVRNAPSLARGTGPVAGSGASGVFPGGAQGSSQAAAPFLDIPAGLFADTSAMTVSTWVKWDGANAGQLPWSYIIGSDALPRDNWGLYHVPNEGGQSKAAANTGTEVKAVSSTPLPTNTWAQITTVATTDSVLYYINGSLVRTEAVALDFAKLASPSSTRSGLIGRVPWAGPYAAFFGGQFDDFAIYRTALTAEQVSAAYLEDAGAIVSVERQSFTASTAAQVAPTLPATVNVTRESGPATAAISWDAVPASAYATAGSTFTVRGTVAGWSTPFTTTVTVTARPPEPIAVDFSQDTGEFRGGASGTLYGLGDEGSPTQALVNGAAMTNVSQKPPFGTQHPGGDAFTVEKTFFDKYGEDLYLYTQDYYPDWPYNGGRRPGDDRSYVRDASGRLTDDFTTAPNGVWDYLEVLEIVVDEVAREAENPEKYVFIPFNEVDLQWLNSDDLYNRFMHVGNQPGSFTPGGATDWAAAWKVITDTYAKHGLERPQIAGPGDAAWRGEGNITTFLNMARATSTVPDIYVWHELRGYQWLPDRASDFRRYAAEVGIAAADIPSINITEWGASTDMSSPANLLRWFAGFEAAKIDAQTAYWTASGTLSDNQAKVNAANGGWWLFKWYGDMTGSRTVAVTANREKAIAAVDREADRAQVIVAGIPDGRDGALTLNGLDAATFGSSVDVEVREAVVSGTDGIAGTPRVVLADDAVAVANGRIELRIPSANSSSAYQVVITPASTRDVEAAAAEQGERHVIEAEATRLTAAAVRTPDGYRASADRDVSGFASAGSRADWSVTVQEAGLYRLQIVGATPGTAAQHAVFVDDAFSTLVQYGANAIKPGNVRTVARGSAEVYVALSAGTHTVGLRTSQDGTTLLPGAGVGGGVTLDRLELLRVGDTTSTESVEYPATTFRLIDGATLSGGRLSLEAGERADLYPSTFESGYYDLVVDWDGAAGAQLTVDVNGRRAAAFTPQAGASTVRVHLPEGISEVELAGTGARVGSVATTRAVEGDASIVRVQAEDLATTDLDGTAEVSGFGGALTNGSGTGYVTGLGITDADPANEGTLTVPRLPGFDEAGAYDAIVHYSNDDIEGTHDYNPQVVDLGLQAEEEGTAGLVGRTTFRYTYSSTNFWEAVLPLDLATDSGPVTFGNTRSTLFIDEGPTGSTSDDTVLPGYAIAPDVDWIDFAPFVLDEQEAALKVVSTATARCIAGKPVVTVTSVNQDSVPVSVAMTLGTTTKSFASVASGKAATHAFTTRQPVLPAGEVLIAVARAGGGAGAHIQTVVPPGITCR